MELSSNAFGAGGEIPRRHICDGDDVSPPLQWHGVPAGTASLVPIVDDADAPDPAAPQRTWVHWVVYDLPPAAGGIAEGARPLPPGAHEGLNDWNRRGWGGHCPPIGRHRHVFELYALDVAALSALARPTKAAVEHAMHGHVLASAERVGTYRRPHARGAGPDGSTRRSTTPTTRPPAVARSPRPRCATPRAAGRSSRSSRAASGRSSPGASSSSASRPPTRSGAGTRAGPTPVSASSPGACRGSSSSASTRATAVTRAWRNGAQRAAGHRRSGQVAAGATCTSRTTAARWATAPA